MHFSSIIMQLGFQLLGLKSGLIDLSFPGLAIIMTALDLSLHTRKHPILLSLHFSKADSNKQIHGIS